MNDYIYSLEFKVRDYECDLQSVVNNAVYQNYLEHTRHEFLKSIGLDFEKLSKQNLSPMVYKSEITYKSSLVSGDEFISTLNVSRKGTLKILFHQRIYRKRDLKLMLTATITKVIVRDKTAYCPNFYFEAINKKIEETARNRASNCL